jgi:hypothetical protein
VGELIPGARRRTEALTVWYCNHLHIMDFLVVCAGGDMAWSLGISAATVYLSARPGFLIILIYHQRKCILSCSDMGLRLYFKVIRCN